MLNKILARAKKKQRTILFPETDDDRILKAVDIINKKGIAKAVVATSIEEGMIALRDGKVDGVVMGASTTTLNVLKNAFHYIGVRDGVKLSSGAFFMILKNRILLFADCAAQVNPNAEQLAEIAKLSAETFEKITGEKAKVAMLSYSTKGSGVGDEVLKVRKATEIAQKMGLNVDGELQVDAALIKSVAEKKCPKSKIAGQANVLIFPDLNAGNIGYKLVERLAGAKAIGPILQGLKRPVSDLSRGCSVDDIVNVAAITSLMVK